MSLLDPLEAALHSRVGFPFQLLVGELGDGHSSCLLLLAHDLRGHRQLVPVEFVSTLDCDLLVLDDNCTLQLAVGGVFHHDLRLLRLDLLPLADEFLGVDLVIRRDGSARESQNHSHPKQRSHWKLLVGNAGASQYHFFTSGESDDRERISRSSVECSGPDYFLSLIFFMVSSLPFESFVTISVSVSLVMVSVSFSDFPPKESSTSSLFPSSL